MVIVRGMRDWGCGLGRSRWWSCIGNVAICSLAGGHGQLVLAKIGGRGVGGFLFGLCSIVL